MRYYILLFFAIFIISCGTAPEKPANVANTANTANQIANQNNPLNTTRTPEAATTNNAPTLAPVVQKYYEALKAKDDQALKKLYSQETLKTLEADMREENKKSLVEFITELEPAPDQPFTTRNENIQGDKATAEIRGGNYPNGIEIIFVKENGEWKLTNESNEVKNVKQAANAK